MDAEYLAVLQAAWLTTTRQAHLPAFEQRLQAAGGLALPRPARAALMHLRESGPMRISDIAAAAGVDISTMSRTLRSLKESGFISRGTGDDLRAVHITITPSGADAVNRLLGAEEQILRQVLASWDEVDRDYLARLLMRFAEDFAAYLSQFSDAESRHGSR